MVKFQPFCDGKRFAGAQVPCPLLNNRPDKPQIRLTSSPTIGDRRTRTDLPRLVHSVRVRYSPSLLPSTPLETTLISFWGDVDIGTQMFGSLKPHVR